MEPSFINFWHLYAPPKKFANRFRACERLWLAMDEKRRMQILRELENELTERSPPSHSKNPYFYLTDWEPPQPQWLSPAQTGHLLAKGISLAVCRNPKTGFFGTVTKEDADRHGLEVHHYM